MSKKKQHDADDGPAVHAQPVRGSAGTSINAEPPEEGEENASNNFGLKIQSPFIVSMALTVVYSNGQGEVMYAVAEDERGLQIEVNNYKRVG